jgi:hypothetical protein
MWDEAGSCKALEPNGFAPFPFVQFQIYHEALLMFYAKAGAYLKTLQKPVSDEWQAGVG